MLGTMRLISKSYKSAVREIGFQLISKELNHYKPFRNARFYYKTLALQPCNRLFQNSKAVKFSSFRCKSAPAAVELKNEDIQQTKSYYQQLLHDRKMQAHRSFLIEVSNKEDIPFAVAHCEKYGAIENVYSYSGENSNYFLLLEFCNENAGKELLLNCRCQNIGDSFPVCSRLIRFEKKFDNGVTKVNIIEESVPQSSLKQGASISEVIQEIYSMEKLTELEIRLRYFFCALIKDSLSFDFPHCDVIPFGSSVNGLGRHGCDLDVMIRLYPEQPQGNGELLFVNKTCLGKHKNYQQKAISGIGEYIRAFSPGISSIEKIMFARVPILKLKHGILKMACDISINNMSAVHMSNVIHFCGEIDDRVRPLMYAVKKWAKEGAITDSSPGQMITNFGLVNMVIFFLQNRPQPILPPFNDALEIIGEENSYEFRVEYLKSIEEWKSDASLNKESLGELLREFFSFLATEPFHDNIISFMTGKQRLRAVKDEEAPLWMQYPFDEGLNITKNVSMIEYQIMQRKAKVSAQHLGNNLKQKVNGVQDFSVLLGIPTVSRIAAKSQKIKISPLVENKGPKNKSKPRPL